jgi:hypothetical protein
MPLKSVRNNYWTTYVVFAIAKVIDRIKVKILEAATRDHHYCTYLGHLG